MSRVPLLFVVSLAVLPRAAWPQGTPLGPEFRVNTYTTRMQNSPSVAFDSAGNFVVVWSSRGQDNPDLQFDIYGQRYASSGAPLGPEFRVNSSTSDNEQYPSVASDPAGNLVVVWSGGSSTDPVLGQRFASSGTPLGSQFRVNTTSSDFVSDPAVASDAAGNFVVVWGSYAPDGSYPTDVLGQRFAASGSPLGPEFRVNTYTTGIQFLPSVAADASGNFIVVWNSDQIGGVYGQRYASSGAPLGAEFRIPTQTSGQFGPSVAADAAGNFVVVWQAGYQVDPYTAIFAQRYASSGAPLGPEFRVNTYTTGSEYAPAVAADATGGFVVVWARGNPTATDFDVFGQRYDSSGTALGLEFRVNTYLTSVQAQPSVASAPSGDFVVTWKSLNQDGSYEGVFAQRYNQIVPVELTRFGVE